jgi:hypothetical protein
MPLVEKLARRELGEQVRAHALPRLHQTDGIAQ